MGRELPAVQAHGELVPDWLSPADLPWLRELCDAASALAGCTRREASERLLLLGNDPRAGRRGPFAARVLAAALGTEPPAGDAPALRLQLARALRAAGDAAAARRQVARQTGLDHAQLLAQLLGDLPGERRLQPSTPSPHELLAACNRTLARGLLRGAAAAELRLCGQLRAVVRQLRLGGLGCEVRPVASGEACIAVLPPPPSQSGRLARALRSLLPLLPWCQRFRLRARVDRGLLVYGTGDPLPVGRPPRRFDSALERTFARDFAALRSGWRLCREAEPIAVGGTLQFPDFRLQHPDGRAVLLEIAGYWRRDYLEAKLALLATCGRRLLLCVDEDAVGDAELPPPVLRFRRRLDAAVVLQRIEGWPGE